MESDGLDDGVKVSAVPWKGWVCMPAGVIALLVLDGKSYLIIICDRHYAGAFPVSWLRHCDLTYLDDVGSRRA